MIEGLTVYVQYFGRDSYKKKKDGFREYTLYKEYHRLYRPNFKDECAPLFNQGTCPLSPDLSFLFHPLSKKKTIWELK